MQKRVLVTGAGGFVGGHLAAYLRSKNYWVRGADIKQPEFAPTSAHEFIQRDLRELHNCLLVTDGIDEMFGLAADMGGIGFITHDKATIVRNNTLINLNSIEAARQNGVNEMIDIIANVAGKTIRKRYDLSKPQGVRARNSDNTKLREVLGWEPQTSLDEGLRQTYEWINEQVHSKAMAA